MSYSNSFTCLNIVRDQSEVLFVGIPQISYFLKKSCKVYVISQGRLYGNILSPKLYFPIT